MWLMWGVVSCWGQRRTLGTRASRGDEPAHGRVQIILPPPRPSSEGWLSVLVACHVQNLEAHRGLVPGGVQV